MHDCVDVDVYLCVGSRPVVERCRGIRVAPAPSLTAVLGLGVEEGEEGDAGGGSEREGKRDGEGWAPNLWNRVDDFDWLREEQSPHWSEIPPGERIAKEKWSDLVPRGAGGGWLEGQVVFGNNGGGRFQTDVEQLLKIVGVKVV